METKIENQTKRIFTSIKKQVKSLSDLKTELTLTFLNSLTIKAMLEEIEHSFGDNSIIQEEAQFLKMLPSVQNLLERNVILRKSLFNISDGKYSKEIKTFMNVYKKQKSNVIKKNMLRSITIKNILLRFTNERPSFF